MSKTSIYEYICGCVLCEESMKERPGTRTKIWTSYTLSRLHQQPFRSLKCSSYITPVSSSTTARHSSHWIQQLLSYLSIYLNPLLPFSCIITSSYHHCTNYLNDAYTTFSYSMHMSNTSIHIHILSSIHFELGGCWTYWGRRSHFLILVQWNTLYTFCDTFIWSKVDPERK